MEGDPFKYKGNNTKIVYLYLIPTVHEMEQTYMKIFKPYTNEVKETSINVLKTQLKGVPILTSSVEVEDEDKDLGGHNYIPSLVRACDHAGLSGLKPAPDTSNYEDLCERVDLLKKTVLVIASFVRDERLGIIKKNKKKQQDQAYVDSPLCIRHQVNLEVVVNDLTVADEKNEKKKIEEKEVNE
ncbi:hypothetical protein FXO37_05980 [Capsicum annuum]|nr:hypothetical protein FXO37_05980 [Capsicum annuum]